MFVSIKSPLIFCKIAFYINCTEKIPILTIFSEYFVQNIYPALMGSKTPTSRFSESKEVRWGSGCP
ncbi:hypothetical protein CW365_26930 [Bacillus cereus]|nr:hypothetical protein [Bacillus paranthracis]PKF96547.1 hypothetical protein CW365_26930 [Bacillus cereus]PNS34308.1 hypothetical protein C1640_00355 [Bacillus sp. AKBS9]